MSFHIVLPSCEDGINFDEYERFDDETASNTTHTPRHDMCNQSLPESPDVSAHRCQPVLPCTDVLNQAHHDLIQSRHDSPTYDTSDTPSNYNPSPRRSMDVDSDPEGNPRNIARQSTSHRPATGSTTRRRQVSTVLY